MENALGYVAFLMGSFEKDKGGKDNRWLNKMALKKYIGLFPECLEALVQKKGEKAPPKGTDNIC